MPCDTASSKNARTSSSGTRPSSARSRSGSRGPSVCRPRTRAPPSHGSRAACRSARWSAAAPRRGPAGGTDAKPPAPQRRRRRLRQRDAVRLRDHTVRLVDPRQITVEAAIETVGHRLRHGRGPTVALRDGRDHWIAALAEVRLLDRVPRLEIGRGQLRRLGRGHLLDARTDFAADTLAGVARRQRRQLRDVFRARTRQDRGRGDTNGTPSASAGSGPGSAAGPRSSDRPRPASG